MYRFMGIWAILENLLSFKVIPTLRYMKNKQNKKRQVAQEYMTWEWLTSWLIDKLTDKQTDWETGWLTRNLAYFNHLHGITLHVWHQKKKKRVSRGFAFTLWHDHLTWKSQLDLKKRKICDVEFYDEFENQIRFSIAIFVLFWIHFEQHAVFTIFGQNCPSPLSNLNKTSLTHALR